MCWDLQPVLNRYQRYMQVRGILSQVPSFSVSPNTLTPSGFRSAACLAAMGKKSTATRIRQGTRLGKAQRAQLAQQAQTAPAHQNDQHGAEGVGDTGQMEAQQDIVPQSLPLEERGRCDRDTPLDDGTVQQHEAASSVGPSPAKIGRFETKRRSSPESSLPAWTDERRMDQPEGLMSQSSSDHPVQASSCSALSSGSDVMASAEPASSGSPAPMVEQEQLEMATSSPELIPASPTPPSPPRPRHGTRAADDEMELLPDVRVNRIRGELRRVSYPPRIEQREGETRLAYLRRAIEESLAFKRRLEGQQGDLSAGKSSQSPNAVFVSSLIFAREHANLICFAWCMFVVVSLLRSGVAQQMTSSSNAGPCASESVCTVDTPRKTQPFSRHSKHSRPHTTKRADPGPKSWSRGYISTRLGRLIVFASPTLSQCIPVKPRVSPVTAAGGEAPRHTSASVITMGAKQSGEGQILLHHNQDVRKATLKKAMMKAKGTSVTQYRGRVLRVESHDRPQQATTAHHSEQPPMLAQPKRRRNRRLSILSYNCGGLTSALYTELLVWLQLHQPDVVFLQETHWASDSTYTATDWHVVSSGCSVHHSGVMILLAKRSFPQPCIRSEVLISGRLLLVKAHQHNSTHYLINVYQKVHDGTKEGLTLRSQVWEALQKAISISPSRHSLIVAGDFNTGLQFRTPCTGTAVLGKGNAAEAADAHVFQQMLKQFDLRALNTFQPEPCKHTYQHPSKAGAKSQIDYILIRGRRTDSRAKITTTLLNTDLGAWRGGPKHWPIMASVPAECYYSPQIQQKHKNEAKHTNAQVRQGKLQLVDVEAFQAAVQARVQCLNTWSTADINQILQEELQTRLVATAEQDTPSCPDAIAPVKRMWQCHREIRTLQRTPTKETEVTCADLKHEFTALQKQVRSMSKLRRQTFIDECVNKATQAARIGDIREVHVQVNRIAPKVVRRQPQLRNAQGLIMTPAQETQALQEYWQGIYCSQHPRPPEPLSKYELPREMLEKALATLPQHKALPGHYAPSLAWKLAAASISALAERTVLQDWRLDQFWIPPEWRHAWLCLILKPNKTGRKAEEYRPIGLTDPVGKAVLGAVYQQHNQAIYDSVAQFPQFAYLARRGVTQALMRAFQHLHQAREAVAQQRITLQQRAAGVHRQQLVGAITVSLDMSKAFDSLEPEFMHQALNRSCLPRDVCRLIEHWHAGVIYHLEHEKCHAQIKCGRGIRQGCKIAPRVWSLFTVLVMHEMGPEWSKKHSNWFADDALFQAMVHSGHELQQQIQAISKALWVLHRLGMTIAPTKCAVLLHLGGTAAKKVRDQVVHTRNKQLHITFRHEDHTWHLPVVDKHDYLGAILSYKKMEDLTATRRIQAAQASFDRLKPVLTRRGLPLCTRLRIWQACVVTSLLYSLPQVGLTPAAAQRVAASYYRQLRHITRQPVHLTGTSNKQLCQNYHVSDPIESIAKRAHKQKEQTERLRTTLSVQDARFSDDIVQCEIRLETQLQQIVRDRTTSPVQLAPSVFPCPDCDYQAGSKAALTKHRNKVHQAALQPSNYLEWKKVDRFEHGTNGLPTCRWCGKNFSSWQQLQRHIHDQVCHQTMRQVPRSSEERDEPNTQCDVENCAADASLLPPAISPTEIVPIAHQTEPTAEPQALDDTSSLPLPPGTPFQAPEADDARFEPQSQPLQPTVRDRQVMHTLRQATPLEALQKHSLLQAELLHHCGLCRQWTPARGGTKIHLRGSHTKEWEQAGKIAEHECLAYASHITSAAGCPFCLAPKFADKRAARAHAQNCQVLFQLVFLRVLSQPSPESTAREAHHLVLKNGDSIPIAIAVPVQSRPTHEQSQFLLRHCCICAQTQPDLRSLKKHLHKAHPGTWITTDSLSQDCRALLTTADKTCPYCNKTSRIAKDHAPYCPVLYQFCMLKRLHCPNLPDRNGSECGGHSGTVVPSTQRKVGKRLRVRGKQSAEALQAGSSHDGRSQREGHREGQGQRQREEQRKVVPGAHVGCSSGSTPSIIRPSDVGVEACAGLGCGGCHLCHGQALLAAGDGAQRAQAGEVFPASRQLGASRHPQATDSGLGQVERASRSDEGGLQSQVRTLPHDAQGNGCAHGEVRANPGQHCCGREGQLGYYSAPHVALPEVGSGCTPSHPRSKPSGYPTPGSQGPAGVHERGTEAGSGGPQSVHAQAEPSRDHEWSLSGVQGDGGASKHPVPDPVRCLCEAGRALRLAADRRQHAQGEAEAWPRSGGGPQPDVALRLRLSNPSATNSCYINSTFLTLVHAWAQGGSLPGSWARLGLGYRPSCTPLDLLRCAISPLFRL